MTDNAEPGKQFRTLLPFGSIEVLQTTVLGNMHYTYEVQWTAVKPGTSGYPKVYLVVSY